MDDLRVGSPEQHHLYGALLGPIHWHLLEFAFKHHLFDHLDSSISAADLAQLRSWCPDRLILILNAYVALGMLTKQQENHQHCYQLSAGYRPYLLSHSEHYLGTTLCHLAKVKACSADWITGLIAPKNPPTSPCAERRSTQESETKTDTEKEKEKETSNMRDGNFWQQAIAGLQAFHLSTRNPILLPLISRHPDWQDGMHILDVGAGSLQLAQHILANHPNTQLTLFDLPACCNQLQQQLAEHSSALRQAVTLRAGDMNDDDFGEGYHLVLASMSLYFATDLQQCIDRLWRSLEPGGLFVSFHEALDASRTQPAFHILGRLPAELANGKLSLKQGQVEAALTAKAPSSMTSEHIITPFGEMTLVIAKKRMR